MITVAIRADALLVLLPRLNAMNSFVQGGSNLSLCVYHYKREALKQATSYGIAAHRRTTIATKCRDCGGTSSSAL